MLGMVCIANHLLFFLFHIFLFLFTSNFPEGIYNAIPFTRTFFSFYVNGL